MKKLLLLIPFALLALCAAGCTTRLAATLNKMPDGKFSSAKLEETAKFTSTSIALTGVVKDDGVLTAASITVDHTNPWLTKLHFEARDYEVQLSRAAQKQPLNPPAAAKRSPASGGEPAKAAEKND